MNLRKPKLLIITSLLFVTCLFIFKSQNSKHDFEKKMHLENLSKSPFTKTKKLSKSLWGASSRTWMFRLVEIQFSSNLGRCDGVALALSDAQRH